MARIKNITTYNYDNSPSLTDYLIGTDTEDSRRTKNYKIGSILTLANTFSTQNGILTGGVSWLQDLDFEISDLTYIIDRSFYSSSSAEVSLNSADPTNPRIDVIAVDTDGLVSVITGTAAATPEKPILDGATQVEITFIQVDAATAVPSGVTEDLVYNEDVGPATEWTATENTSGAIINLADTTDPYSGTVSISWTEPALTGNTATFVSSSTIDVVDFTTLHFYIKLQSAWEVSGAGIIVTLLNGATEVTQPFTITSTSFGFSNSDITNYQGVILDAGKLTYSGTAFDTITISLINIEDGLFLDFVRVLGGMNNPPELGSYLSLSDVNDKSYVGKAGYFPVVDDTEKGLDFVSPSVVSGVSSFNTRTGAVVPIVGDYDSFFVELSGDTMTGDLIVPDEAYGVAWNANLEVPTKNAVYDEIESLVTGVSSFNSRVGAVVPTAGDYDAFYFTETESDARYVEITGDTMTGDLIVPDEVYGVAWDANLEVPTKNAVYDKIETLVGAGVTSFNTRTGAVVPTAGDYDAFYFTETESDARYVEITGDTMTGDLIVPDEAYGVAWNANLEVPTKNAIYDHIEALALNDLTDVTLAGEVEGQFLIRTGSLWENNTEVSYLSSGGLSTTRTQNGVSFNKLLDLFVTDLGTESENWTQITMGKAASTLNSAEFSYIHLGDGSATNYFSLGLYGNQVLELHGDLSQHWLGDSIFLEGTGDAITFTSASATSVLIDATGSSAGDPAIFGMSNMNSGTEGARWQFGDAFNVIENQFGEGTVIKAYHNIIIDGGSESLTAIDYTDPLFAEDATQTVRILQLHDRGMVVLDSTATSRTENILEFQISTGTVLSGVGTDGSYFTVDEAYGVAWNANLEVPTKNAVYDEMELKLDSADYTAADVLAKLLTVDGSGSGLDADLLDGLDSASTSTVSTIVARDASADIYASDFRANNLVVSGIGGVNGNSIRVYGTGTGTSNVAYIDYWETGGSTRQGYIGFASGSNSDMRMFSDANGDYLLIDEADSIDALKWNYNATEYDIWHSGTVEISNSRLRATSTADATLTSTTHGFQVGLTTSINLICDINELMVRNNGAASSLSINRDGGSVAIGAATAAALTVGSTVTATNFILSSDKRLKNNIKDYSTKPIDVNWKTFEFKDTPELNKRVQLGVIAQELEKKHPEFVTVEENGMKSVAYTDLLVAKVAELQDRIEKLERLR